MQMRSNNYDYSLIWLILLLLQLAVVEAAEPKKQSRNPSENCTVQGIRDIDSELLTREEEIALLDVALYDSMDRFDNCEQKALEKDNQANTLGSNMGGGAAGGGGGSTNSVAKTAQQDNSKSTKQTSASAKDNVSKGVAASNGAIPKDIPPTDNDTILQKQIRAAAIKEKDPEKQKKLWEMYRKYKQ